MIVGMNPKTLRLPRTWNLYLWPKRHHWVLVAQPAGPEFTARLVDDFVHNAQHCFSTEVPSSRFFLVYELLVEQGELFLMLSVKPDFDMDGRGVWPLGTAGPMAVAELQEHALGVVRRYRSYSYIGCNCQHFATDLALSLNVPRRALPEDEASAVAHAASDGAAAFGAAGVAIAATAAVGAGCASAVGATAPCAAATLMSCLPVVLSTVAVTATAVGLGGGLALIGIAGGYKMLYDRLREGEEEEIRLLEKTASLGSIWEEQRPESQFLAACEELPQEPEMPAFDGAGQIFQELEAAEQRWEEMRQTSNPQDAERSRASFASSSSRE